ncbi:natural resistance-associated macrophage protein 2-like [Kryptolebias marmoratus]|uniref:natural resistance-associated macrophage protein 2-like n=1 Tax=Kryptolebias marmoratus TaxID=37003 RepID=UPI0018ACD9E8|nr:natural resistance-associated macrophage protein 2-like [Kryptolebias marmoratus]
MYDEAKSPKKAVIQTSLTHRRLSAPSVFRQNQNNDPAPSTYFDQRVHVSEEDSEKGISLRKLLSFTGPGFLMSIAYLIQYATVAPDQGQLLKGMFVPYCEGCGPVQLGQAVGIVCAVIMPHNSYLHSALVKSREVDRSKKKEVKEANKYFFIESTVALFVSFLINVFVVAIFAEAFYQCTNIEVYNVCNQSGSPHSDLFSLNNKTFVVDLFKGIQGAGRSQGSADSCGGGTEDLAGGGTEDLAGSSGVGLQAKRVPQNGDAVSSSSTSTGDREISQSTRSFPLLSLRLRETGISGGAAATEDMGGAAATEDMGGAAATEDTGGVAATGYSGRTADAGDQEPGVTESLLQEGLGCPKTDLNIMGGCLQIAVLPYCEVEQKIILFRELLFALITILTFTSMPSLMNEFVNRLALKIGGGLVILCVCSINMYFVVVYMTTLHSMWLYVLAAFLSTAYLTFVGYLVWLFLIALGLSYLDPSTRKENDLTILIKEQPEFDS